MNVAAGTIAPRPVLLDDLVRRIRTVIEPKRILLFGSAARGTMGPDSDLDVLVVAEEGAEIGVPPSWRPCEHREQIADLHGAGEPTLVALVAHFSRFVESRLGRRTSVAGCGGSLAATVAVSERTLRAGPRLSPG